MPQPLRNTKLHRSFTEALRGAWRSVARPEQIAPPGDWTRWVFCGGRGSGKTRSGSEWVLERVAAGSRRIHLIAPTAADARDVMLEGPAGILSIAPSHLRPVYQPSLRKITFPNGAVGLLFSSDEPDRLRGVQCHTAWIDELCAMRQAEAVLANMDMGLRVGKDPRCLITTTPRPLKCFKQLLARDGQDVIVTRSSSYRNRDNLAPSFFASIVHKYAGTRLGRQELEAELLTDVPGALWHLEQIEELRVRVAPQPFERVVIAIDPATTHGPDSDETGIIVAALARDGAAYVLDDLSGRYPPEEWARRAIGAYRTYSADRIIGETNNGGQLVEHTLRSVDPSIPFRAVHASRGKLTRAEPVSALYEQGKVHHVATFGPLEDQLTSYDGSRTGSSPDRLDALVWGLTELMLAEPPGRFLREASLLGTDAAPVAMPKEVASVFAVATVVETEPDTLAAVYFATTGREPACIVIDWSIEPLEQSTLDAFFPATIARLKELAELTASSAKHAPLLIEPAGFGVTLLEQARLRLFPVMEISDAGLLAKTLATRVIDTGTYLAAGAVKIAREAHEKAVTFKGVHRNHLASALAAFTLTEKEPKVSPLLAAFVTGALDVVSGSAELNIWRALGAKTAPGSLVQTMRAETPRPAAPIHRPDADVLRPDSPQALRAARLRAESEARCERESEQARAAARIRDARMRGEELRGGVA